MNKILLIQVWLGDIPDYFWYHYETTKNIKNIDFLFITDQTDIKLDSRNYKLKYINKELLEKLVSNKLDIDFKLINNKKVCDLKSSYGDLFEKELDGYSHFGFYDIDTLFGDINSWIGQYLEEYDIISFGDKNFHNRISGPFMVLKNNEKMRNLYKLDINSFIDCFKHQDVMAWDEHQLFDIVKSNVSYKILYDTINCDINGKNTYDSIWSGGKVFVNGVEKFIYHFYRKNDTKINRIGNIISAHYDKTYCDDFMWVVHFSENYEKLVPQLIDSLKKYSNRKCVFYTINYISNLSYQTQYNSDQFIFRRIDIPEGKKDSRGRDVGIMNSKPKILMDVIKSFPNKKFVHVDTDISLTVNSDDISKYIQSLENYPLANSHVHDVIYINNVIPGEEWTSSLHVLLKEEQIDKPLIFPRRKCNIILFDERSLWFFEEQIKLYEKYSDSPIPGILSIVDEDSFNALLCKYELKNSLPLLDIEESYNLDLNKLNEYSYSIITSWISPNVILPKTINDFLFFHGFKNPDDFKKINDTYGSDVLDCEDLVIYYKNNTIFFERNSFLRSKKNLGLIDFVIKDINKNEIFTLYNQNLMDYSIFYISQFHLEKGKYYLELYKKDNNQKVFSNVFEIK